MAQETSVPAVTAPQATQSSSFFGTGLRVDLGLGAALSPAYEGSKTQRVTPLPYVNIEGLLDDRVSISAAHGLAVNVIEMENIKAGVGINYSSGRSRSNSGRVNGLPDINGAAVMSGFVTYDWRPFSVGLEVQNRIGPNPGTVVSLGGGYSFHPIPDLRISLGPKVNFADREYEQTFFGVSESSAARATALGNPMRAYSATAGIKNVELVLAAKYTITRHWSAAARVALSELVGSAANSPLTQQKFQPSVGVGVIYGF
jgi:outer membrane protein